jgi:hypothetical protein
MLLPRRPRISRAGADSRIPADHPAATRPLSSPAVQTARRTRRTISPPGAGHLLPGSPPGAPTGQPWGPSGPATWQSAPPPFPPSGPYQPPRRRNRTGVWAGLAVLLVVLGLLAWQVTGFGAAICGPVTCPARRFRAVRPRRSHLLDRGHRRDECGDRAGHRRRRQWRLVRHGHLLSESGLVLTTITWSRAPPT